MLYAEYKLWVSEKCIAIDMETFCNAHRCLLEMPN